MSDDLVDSLTKQLADDVHINNNNNSNNDNDNDDNKNESSSLKDDDDDDTSIEGIEFVDYMDESQLEYVMDLVGRDLSEPYSST